jgi:hypothetical protein
MGESDRAIRELEMAGDDPDALYNLGLVWFYKGEWSKSVDAFRRALFENLFLAGHLAEIETLPEIPRYRGTHPKGLDTDEAAYDYLERCGDLWRGRPLLAKWLRAIYEHPVVKADLKRHLEHLKALCADDVTAGDRARLEGENTTLRSDSRLATTNRAIAEEIVQRLFVVG